MEDPQDDGELLLLDVVKQKCHFTEHFLKNIYFLQDFLPLHSTVQK